MSTAIARVATPLAGRYLTQLCKHFEHKLAVTHGDGAGQIAFSFGTCRLRAEADTLVLEVQAGTAEETGRLQDVVARHLERFAFRAPLEIVWQPG